MWHVGGQTDGQTDRQTDMYTCMQAGGQSGRQTRRLDFLSVNGGDRKTGNEREYSYEADAS